MVQPLSKTVRWFLTKSKHTLTIQPSNHIPLYLLKGTENVYPHENLHTDVYSSFIHNCQNLEATKLSFSRWWINKLWCTHTMEYYSELKRNELSIHEKTWRKLKCISLTEGSQSEKATYCMSLSLWHSVKGKTMETVKKKSVVARA